MDDDTRFLAAVLKREWDSYDALVDEFETLDKGTPVAVIAVAFDRLTKQYFARSTDRAAGIIEIIEQVDTGLIAEIEGQLLFKMVHDRQMSPDQIDAFLRDVESQLAQLQGGAS